MDDELIRNYHRAFLDYLGYDSLKDKNGANKARQKLLNLSHSQFTELSTDVYDELQRRLEDQDTRQDNLSFRDDLHTKRNQARQKLAILSSTRFEDLSTDIFYEIERRYPHLKEENVQKQALQENTIIPTKSTLVEEGEDSEDDTNAENGGFHYNDYNDSEQIPEDEFNDQSNREAPRPLTLGSIAEEANEEEHNNYNQAHGDDINEQIKDRDEQIQMLVAEGSRMDESINKLEAQLAESERLKNSLVSENDRLNKLVEELENEKEQMNGELHEQKDRSEAEISRYQDQLRDTEKKLATVEAENITMRDNNANGTVDDKKYLKLKKDHERLQHELEQQQKITDQVRNEASMFLEEMRSLASSNNMEMDVDKMQELKAEVQEWKSRYQRAKGQVRDMRASTYQGRNLFQPSSAPVEQDSPYYDEKNGKVKDSSLTKFQIAMDEFLVKSRADSANILDNLHYLVVATRRVTQDITDGEDRATDSEQQSQIAQCTSLVSTTANHLITTTRNHATSGGLAPMSVLDAAASDLSSAVIELVKVAKIRPGSELNEETPPPRPNSYAGEPATETESQPNGLGIMTDTNSTTTTAAAATNGKMHDEPENEDEDTYYTDGKDRKLQKEIDDNPISVKKREFTNYHQHSPSNNFDIADPDNTVAELQGYLEEKTVGVIDSIQSLLTGIRDNEIMETLRPHIDNITVSVDKMIEATGSMISNNRQLNNKGSYILANLTDCSQRMTNLKTDSNHLEELDHPDRHLKQRLAGISFDMAKCTKELVKTVEEVSLNQEIYNIDEQLGS